MSVPGKDTVRSFAEANGYPDVDDDVCARVAADLEYRLREITQEAAKFARQSKRRRLSPEDVNMALRLRNLEPLYGYASWSTAECDAKTYGFRRAGNSDAYYLPAKAIDLTSLVKSNLPKCPVDVTLRSHWLAIEGVQPDIPQNPPRTDQRSDLSQVQILKKLAPDQDTVAAIKAAETESGTGAAGTAGAVVQLPGSGAAAAAIAMSANPAKAKAPIVLKPIERHELSAEQQLYYTSITEGLLENKKEFCDQAFESLAKDPGLHPLLPYFAQFVHQKVTESLGNLPVLTSMVKLEKSLLSNPNLFAELYLHQMLPPLLTCVVSKSLTGPAEDHWSLRKLAAQTVAKICEKYGAKYSVQSRVTKTMIGAILNPEMALVSQYGALIQLKELGPHVLDAVLIDHVKVIHEMLERKKRIGPQENKDAIRVKEALLLACEVYMNWQKTSAQVLKSPLPTSDVAQRFKDIREIFGDQITPS